jgi:hypothetical protein
MPTTREILSDPTTSNWMKRALTEALLLDPVDAANEAEVLTLVLSERADNLLKGGEVMTSDKHTPRPWKIEGRSGNPAEGHVIVSNERTIAWTANSYDDATNEEFVSEEDEANANLIAAAPVLLELLQAINDAYVSSDTVRLAGQIGTIRAAIANASPAAGG